MQAVDMLESPGAAVAGMREGLKQRAMGWTHRELGVEGKGKAGQVVQGISHCKVSIFLCLRSPTVSECISEFSIPMRKHEQKQEFILAYGSRGIDHEDKGYMAASS